MERREVISAFFCVINLVPAAQFMGDRLRF